jgi:integrase
VGAKDYLKLRDRTWYVQVSIPARLRKAAGGKSEFIKSLKTGDLNEANRLKHAHIAAFKHRIAALERQHSDATAFSDLYEKALAWRDVRDRYKGKVLFYEGDDPDKPYYATDEFLSQIADEAEEFAEEHGDEAAKAFFRIAKGEGTPVREHVETWLAEESDRLAGQTVSQHRTVLRAFTTWAGEGVLVQDVNQRRAGEYVSHLRLPSSGLSRQTAKRYVSSLSAFWKWLMARGFTEANPWLNQGLGKKPARGKLIERQQWSDDALVKVLTGTCTPRYTKVLRDLVRLALVTGARLDELCALKPDDVKKRDDGWWLTIREGKTEAALRDIPVHASVVHILTRRKREGQKYLFEGLVPGGPDSKRSWNVSKAFGHYTRSLDLGDERRVFHALRNTFIEVMEAAAVPESTTKLIVGHARHSMTYGHYSQGDRVNLRNAINELHYSSKLMRLIRADLTDRKSSGRRQAVSAAKSALRDSD